MKKKYILPEIDIMKYTISDILAASDDEVFVDGGDFFEE